MKELETREMKEVKRFKVKLEVSSTSKSVDVRLAEVLEWLVADPQVALNTVLFFANHMHDKQDQVCALWPQLACQLGLSGQVPLLAGIEQFYLKVEILTVHFLGKFVVFGHIGNDQNGSMDLISMHQPSRGTPKMVRMSWN